MYPTEGGKILGVDYGMRRVGLAVTDPERTMVFPRDVLMNAGEVMLFQALKEICQDEKIVLVVLGYPFDDRHVETEQTLKMHSFGQRLSEYLQIPVDYEDEKYTTAEAEAMMEFYGFDYKEKKAQRDSIAAMLILQSYLGKV